MVNQEPHMLHSITPNENEFNYISSYMTKPTIRLAIKKEIIMFWILSTELAIDPIVELC